MDSGRLQKVRDKVYSLNKKNIVCIYLDSPQEKCKFCDYQEIIAKLDGKIKKSESQGCTILLLPFTIRMNRQGDLGSDCITKPIDYLKSMGLKVSIVYLRKRIAKVGLVDDLMKDLAAQEIRSEKDEASRQADELWKIMASIL